MNLGSFGIAHPIYNNRFNRMASFESTLVSLSTRTLTYTDPAGGGTYHDRIFGYCQGDNIPCGFCGRVNRIVIGPSTHSSNPGAIEVCYPVYGSISANTAYLENIPAYSYTAGDPVTLLTIGAPAGWWLSAIDRNDHDFQAGRIVASTGTECDVGVYGFNIRAPFGWTGDTTRACLLIDRLMPRTVYKLDVRYKQNNYFALYPPEVSVYEGAQVQNTASIIDLDDDTETWVNASSIFTSSTTQSADAYIEIFFPDEAETEYTSISSISLSHASFADAYTYINDGVASFVGVCPVRGSVRVQRHHESSKLARTLQGSKYVAAPFSGDFLPLTRYSLSYTLQNVPSASVLLLRRLFDWQERGYLLNHYPGLTGVPYCLTGRIRGDIDEMLNINDLSISQFRLGFEEVVC